MLHPTRHLAATWAVATVALLSGGLRASADEPVDELSASLRAVAGVAKTGSLLGTSSLVDPVWFAWRGFEPGEAVTTESSSEGGPRGPSTARTTTTLKAKADDTLSLEIATRRAGSARDAVRTQDVARPTPWGDGPEPRKKKVRVGGRSVPSLYRKAEDVWWGPDGRQVKEVEEIWVQDGDVPLILKREVKTGGRTAWSYEVTDWTERYEVDGRKVAVIEAEAEGWNGTRYVEERLLIDAGSGVILLHERTLTKTTDPDDQAKYRFGARETLRRLVSVGRALKIGDRPFECLVFESTSPKVFERAHHGVVVPTEEWLHPDVPGCVLQRTRQSISSYGPTTTKELVTHFTRGKD